MAPLLPPPTFLLPSGLRVRYVSRNDVPFLYKEIYERRCYLQHGLTLRRGGTVIDVGGNIGLFAMFAAEQLGPEGLVISCEPLPPTFNCLQHNAAAHQQWWQQQAQQQGRPHAEADRAAAAGAGDEQAVQGSSNQRPQGQTAQPGSIPSGRGSAGSGLPARVLPLNVGVSDGSATEAAFTFYPRAAGWSSMQPDGPQVVSDMGAFLSNALYSRQAAEAAGISPSAAAAGAWLRRWAPAWLYNAAWHGAVRVMLGGAQRVRCPLLTVSQLIREHQLQAVDLLKVDVERAELSVLRGVEACHWPLVRQAALEVHDASLEEVLQVLRQDAGFKNVAVVQDAALAGSSLHAVYCRRE